MSYFKFKIKYGPVLYRYDLFVSKLQWRADVDIECVQTNDQSWRTRQLDLDQTIMYYSLRTFPVFIVYILGSLSKEKDSVINKGQYIADNSGVEVHGISVGGTSFSVLPGSQQRLPLVLDNPDEVTKELAKKFKPRPWRTPAPKQNLYAMVTASSSEKKQPARKDELS